VAIMINILKPLEAWATHSKHNEFHWATLKLTFYYVLSTAVILLVSSAAVLAIFAPPAIEIPSRPEMVGQVEIEQNDWGLHEAREHLATVIFAVDILILLIVSVLAYYFARRTLSPIQDMHEKQRQFLGDVAHELRTPLSVMQAGADSTLHKERSSEEYQSFVTDVQSEARRLTRLTDQFLSLLRTGNIQTANFTKENLSVIVANEVRQFTSYAKEHKVILKSNIDADVYLETSRDKLVEVTQNLLKNAIDYNKPEGSVTISLNDSDTAVTLQVSDTGVGIPREQQGVVFDRFKKIDTARTQIKNIGTGLGLSIVKKLVSDLDGKIILESEVGLGTKIHITIPKNNS